MTKFLQDLFFLLKDVNINMFSWLFMFLLSSGLELVGLGMVGGYVAVLTAEDPSSVVGVGRLFEHTDLSSIEITFLGGALLIGVFSLRAGLIILVNRKIFRFSADVMVQMRTMSMKFYQNRPYTEHIKRGTPEYLRAILQYSNSVATSTTSLLSLTGEVVVAVFVVVALMLVDWLAVSILIGSFSCAFLIFDKYVANLLQTAGKIQNKAGREATRAVHEGFSGLKELRSLGCEDIFLEHLTEQSRRLGAALVFAKIMNLVPRLAIELLIIGTLLAFVSVTLFNGAEFEAILPLLAMFSVAALRIGPSAALVTSSIGQLRVLAPGVSDLASDFRSGGKVQSRKELKLESAPIFRRLNLLNVSYRYPDSDSYVLSQIKLEINSGDLLGLTGKSGSGKTTLIDLILGLLEPTEGDIKFNDSIVDSVGSHWLGRVAYLPQNVFIMDKSIWENITIGKHKSEVKLDHLKESCKSARILDLIEGMPNGFDTQLGEGGVRLSGGQRQRLALARAFYHDRDVLILDEATSALDKATEEEVIKEITFLKGRVTMIVITHESNVLANCDRIFELKNGELIQVHGPVEA
jgi:ATP-binding cassette, subfamily B, bacterial PglK